MKPENIEKIYDYIDFVSSNVYEYNHTPYLKGIKIACDILLNDETLFDLPADLLDTIQSESRKIEDISFEKEEVRKSLQLSILKGYKHAKINNQEITPDTIGMLIAYILNKIFDSKDQVSLFDPLVGTANLITTVANHLNAQVSLIGVDLDETRFEVAQAMFDMMDYGDQLYYQDTFTFWNLSSDVIVTDFSYYEVENNTYFPYELILHHESNLKNGGYFVAVIYNDFFENELSEGFRSELLLSFNMIGLIKLPDSLFKNLGKSILILQKKDELLEDEEKSFLLADIPSFEDEHQFTSALRQINQWFENRKNK